MGTGTGFGSRLFIFNHIPLSIVIESTAHFRVLEGRFCDCTGTSASDWTVEGIVFDGHLLFFLLLLASFDCRFAVGAE